jgi:hypothetical protein
MASSNSSRGRRAALQSLAAQTAAGRRLLRGVTELQNGGPSPAGLRRAGFSASEALTLLRRYDNARLALDHAAGILLRMARARLSAAA